MGVEDDQFTDGVGSGVAPWSWRKWRYVQNGRLQRWRCYNVEMNWYRAEVKENNNKNKIKIADGKKVGMKSETKRGRQSASSASGQGGGIGFE